MLRREMIYVSAKTDESVTQKNICHMYIWDTYIISPCMRRTFICFGTYVYHLPIEKVHFLFLLLCRGSVHLLAEPFLYIADPEFMGETHKQ